MSLGTFVSLATSPEVRQFVTAVYQTVSGIQDAKELVEELAVERWHLKQLLETLKRVEERVNNMSHCAISEVETLAEIMSCRQDIQELLNKTDPSIPENRSWIEQLLGSRQALQQTLGTYQGAGRRLNERMTAWQLQYTNMMPMPFINKIVFEIGLSERCALYMHLHLWHFDGYVPDPGLTAMPKPVIKLRSMPRDIRDAAMWRMVADVLIICAAMICSSDLRLWFAAYLGFTLWGIVTEELINIFELNAEFPGAFAFYIPIFLWMRRLRLVMSVVGSLHCLYLSSALRWAWWGITLPQLVKDLSINLHEPIPPSIPQVVGLEKFQEYLRNAPASNLRGLFQSTCSLGASRAIMAPLLSGS